MKFVWYNGHTRDVGMGQHIVGMTRQHERPVHVILEKSDILQLLTFTEDNRKNQLDNIYRALSE